MSRFFRSLNPLLRSIGNVSKPAVALGVAAAVPNNEDAPDYVQDVFKEFSSNYQHRKNDTYQKQTGMDHAVHHAPSDMHDALSSKEQHVTPMDNVEAAAETVSVDSQSITQSDAMEIVQQALMEQIEEEMTSEDEEAKLQKMESALQEIKETLQSVPADSESSDDGLTTKAVAAELKEMEILAAPTNTALYLADFIDHTVLKPKSTEEDIVKMCVEAKEYKFFSVCCNPCWVPKCKELLADSNVKICCVVGFPLGANTSDIKAMEAIHAVHDGADEIDMVMNIGKAKSGDWDFVQEDIAKVVSAVEEEGVAVKVILETCFLSDDEVVRACKCATNAKAKFVKTSTGFGGGGATVHHVELMRKTVDDEAVHLGMDVGSVFVKASGGIRDTARAEEMIQAGANRIGASSGIKIIGAHDTSPVISVAATNATKLQEQY